MTHEVRTIEARHLPQLVDIIKSNPVRHCYVASRVLSQSKSFLRSAHSDVYGFFSGDELISAMLVGANLVPINTTAESRAAFAKVLARQGRRCSSIVGPDSEVLDLWSTLESAWGKAREVRSRQPVMALSQRSLVVSDDLVRYAHKSDLDVLLPACIDMFTNEVGISPVAFGTGTMYRNRIAEIIAARHSFVRIDDGQIIFKAEIGSVGAGVAQIQGVWVHPNWRGKGLSVPGMAAVTKYVLDDIAGTASLYVNDFNTVAIAAYKSVGYEQVDTFATVLF